MKKLIVLIMAAAFVFTSAGLCFASQTEGGDSLGGLTDLFSGIGDSLGTTTEGGDGEGGNALSGIMDMFSGITDSAKGEDGEGGSALSGIMNMFSGITDSIKKEDGKIDTGSILSGLGGLISGLAESGSEESVDAQQAGTENGQAEEVQTEEVQGEADYTYKLNWEDIEKEVKEMELSGRFVTIDKVKMEMWIPELLLDTEIPDELADAGYIGLFMTENDEAYASVQCVPTDVTLEDYAELLRSMNDKVAGMEKYLVNGRPSLIYYVSETDSMALATLVEGKGLVEFAFAPMSKEEYAAFVDIMVMSVRPVE